MTPQILGLQIRSARKAAGLRQDELAAASGVGLRFLVELERGKGTSHLGKALQVLDTLGLTVAVIPRAGPAAGARS